MSVNMKGKDFLTLAELTEEEILQIIDTAANLKMKKQMGEPHEYLKGKTLGMIFQKSSTRTRVSFEVAMVQLGGYPLYLNPSELQMGRGETIADTARVLSRYLDGIMIRTYAHSDVEELAKYANIPIINGLTDYSHPGQILADFLTIREKKGTLKGLKLAYVGDGNNVAHALMVGAAKVGMDIVIGCPKGYEPSADVLKLSQELAAQKGSKVEVVNDPVEAVKDADVLYTDVWASMGQEAEHAERVKIFMPYQINSALVANAKADAIVLHCLPAHRGEEITDEVIDGPQSFVFDEAENRLHIHKAILALLL